MDIAFLCGLFPHCMEENIVSQSIGRIDYAANKLQWSFVKGLDAHNNKPIRLFNSIYISSYPKGYKKLIVNSMKFSHTLGADDTNIGFCNLIGYKFISRFFTTFLCINKWARDNSKEKKVLLVYAMHTPFLLTAFFSKIINKELRLCLIVPDLPQYMSDSNNLAHRVLKYIDSKIMRFLLQKIDSFVLLSDFMVEKIDIRDRPYTRIEGIFDDSAVPFESLVKTDNYKIVMYSGNLDISQGIINLLNAFSKIKDDNFRLWFTGQGSGLKYIKEYALNDSRIIYFSNLSISELYAKQRVATLLVNPISFKNDKVKYFFPSKTMEYLASGTPTLMFKLPSLPIEYNDYLFFFDGESIDNIKDKIIDICKMSTLELNEFGYRGRSFILKSKTQIPQCEKLYIMLNKL